MGFVDKVADKTGPSGKMPKARSPKSADRASLGVELPGAMNTEQLRMQKQVDHEKVFLENLLQVEAKIRSFSTLQELKYYTANELKSVLNCRQIMVLRKNLRGNNLTIDTVSNLAMPDQHSPLLQWLTVELNHHLQLHNSTGDEGDNKELDRVCNFRLRLETAPQSGFQTSNVLAVQLKDPKGIVIGAIVFLAETPFENHNKHLAARLGDTVSHAWVSLLKGKIRSAFTLPRPVKFLFGIGILIAAFIPVPLTVLAPVSIVPEKPKLVSAPLNGVIKNILVQPNSHVSMGDILFSFEKTEAKNLVDQTEQGLAVAIAKYQRANQDAFDSSGGRKDIGVLSAELQLAVIEKNSANRKLLLADVRAETSGIVLFDSKEKWIGRPVTVGERVMKIAHPNQIQFKLDLPAQEAIILSNLKHARIFLDSDPLHPFDANVTRTSYEAQFSDAEILVFPLYAKKIEKSINKKLRIGLRGTAQISGDKVPLWFFLFRKPLSFLRQFTGF